MKHESKKGANVKRQVAYELVNSIANTPDTTSMTLEFVLTELAQTELVRLVNNKEQFDDPKSAIESAWNKICDDIEKRTSLKVKRGELRKKLDDIFGTVSDKLRETSKEIIESGKSEKYHNLQDDKEDCFSISNPELTKIFEFILVKPDESVSGINLDSLRNRGFECRGEWFPYEISYEQYTFVLDDDWTIFVSTENQTEKNALQVREYIINLARRIYF
jgi:hypothetical protein